MALESRLVAILKFKFHAFVLVARVSALSLSNVVVRMLGICWMLEKFQNDAAAETSAKLRSGLTILLRKVCF